MASGDQRPRSWLGLTATGSAASLPLSWRGCTRGSESRALRGRRAFYRTCVYSSEEARLCVATHGAESKLKGCS